MAVRRTFTNNARVHSLSTSYPKPWFDRAGRKFGSRNRILTSLSRVSYQHTPQVHMRSFAAVICTSRRLLPNHGALYELPPPKRSILMTSAPKGRALGTPGTA